MPATAGQTMLDTAGKCILRTDGTKQLADGSGDACCCAGHACYQLWEAYWDCDTLAWVITQAGKLCLPDTTDESWIGSGCTGWIKYTAMGHVCTSDGDCGGYPDTPTPTPPNGGEEPADCYCPCIDVCGCFNVGRTATVSFVGVENGMPCIECPAGSGNFYKAGTGTLGTYTFTRTGLCSFAVTITGTSYQLATGQPTGVCPPDAAFEDVPLTLTGSLTFDGVGTWTLDVFQEDAQIFFGTAAQGDCDGPLVFTNAYTAYDPCGATTFAYMINGTATVVFKPCTPP